MDVSGLAQTFSTVLTSYQGVVMTVTVLGMALWMIIAAYEGELGELN